MGAGAGRATLSGCGHAAQGGRRCRMLNLLCDTRLNASCRSTDGREGPSLAWAGLRMGRRARIVGALIVASLGLAGKWARERVASRDARAVRQAMAGGRFAAAEAPILRWLKSQPDSAEAHLYKGRFELARNNLNGAIEGLRRARSLGGPGPQLDLLQAMIAANRGRPMEAEPVLRRAFEDARQPDPQLDEALARVYLETFDLVRAAAVLDRWAREAPDDPRPHLWRVEIDSRRESAPDLRRKRPVSQVPLPEQGRWHLRGRDREVWGGLQ
jgi:tetratricopeptide (TPR) repeat protein